MSGNEDASINPPPSTGEGGESQAELTRDQRELIVKEMLSVKENLQAEMAAIQKQLAGIKNGMSMIGEIDPGDLLPDTGASQIRNRKRNGFSGKAVTSERGQVDPSDSDVESDDTGELDIDPVESPDFKQFSGEGWEYSTKNARPDLDRPGSWRQFTLFFCYVVILSIIAYQLHILFSDAGVDEDSFLYDD